MHNRRKSDLVSEDIYTIGYSVINQLKDRRLSKVLKQGGAINTRDNSNDVSMNVVDSNSLLETYVALKDSVTDLTIAVSSLTGELTTLREKVALLEMRLYDGGPAAQLVDGMRATTAETHEKSTNYTYTVTDPDEPAAQQADPVIDMIPETQELSTNKAVTVPTSLSSSQRSYADVTSHATTGDVTSAFRLPGQQRRRTRRGVGIQASSRPEINGAASSKLRISSATKDDKQRLYHVYVGKLKENTSKKAVFDHLHDIGMSHVSDVIQLHRKTGGQASFCVSVDNSDDEDAMYNPDKWPAGALTRPYKLRTQTTRNQQHTIRDQRPPRHRTHQEPRAPSYRQQVAARSSDRPTEYSRARDSYDSGKTYYGDDADNTYARNNRSGVERRRDSYRPYCSYNSY